MAAESERDQLQKSNESLVEQVRRLESELEKERQTKKRVHQLIAAEFAIDLQENTEANSQTSLMQEELGWLKKKLGGEERVSSFSLKSDTMNETTEVEKSQSEQARIVMERPHMKEVNLGSN